MLVINKLAPGNTKRVDILPESVCVQYYNASNQVVERKYTLEPEKIVNEKV